MGEHETRKWLLLTRNNGQVLDLDPGPWGPWKATGPILPTPDESMRDVALEALTAASKRSVEREFAPLTASPMFYVDDLVNGRVLTLDDGTELWMAIEGETVVLDVSEQLEISWFTETHIIAKVPRHKGAAQPHAFAYDALAPKQGK